MRTKRRAAICRLGDRNELWFSRFSRRPHGGNRWRLCPCSYRKPLCLLVLCARLRHPSGSLRQITRSPEWRRTQHRSQGRPTRGRRAGASAPRSSGGSSCASLRSFKPQRFQPVSVFEERLPSFLVLADSCEDRQSMACAIGKNDISRARRGRRSK